MEKRELAIEVRPPLSLDKTPISMRTKRFSGLFFNAVLALSLISLVPLVFIGVHLTRVNSRILQQEIFQKQQTVAGRLATVVHSYITHASEFFTVFIDLHTDFGGHAFLDQADLDYLRQRDLSLSYVAVLNTSGKRLFYSGTPEESAQIAVAMPTIINTCVHQQEHYIGPGYFVQGRGWFFLMAFPVYESLSNRRVSGVLVVELDLKDLGHTLMQAYPLEMEAFVVNADNRIISYNGAPDGLAQGEEDALQEQLGALQNLLEDNSSAEVQLPGGKKWLVASSNLFVPGWKVYVAQPANVAWKLVFNSTVHSVWDGLRIVLIMFLFIVGVSYWVIIPITRPLERLRKAVLRLQQGDGEIDRADVEIPHNEIGDLAEAFVDMSKELQTRRKTLLSAQYQLSQANQDLEKRVEERTRELREATNELVKKERLATMGQMASIISHEIRNPLAVISNATRLIKTLVKTTDAKVEKQFSIIDAEIKQANSIISEVLGFARSRDLILSTIDLNSYLHDILLSYPFAPGIKLDEQLDAESVRIKIDVEEMKQALRNLLANAAEAMLYEGTITVGTQVGKKVVCIYVKDNGPGISTQVRQKIFAPFFTTKARGTGLGLAVVGKAVARHQGKLFIRSQEGQGACFKIYLKIYQKPGDTNYG